MLDTVLVGLIVLAAALYLGRHFRKALDSKGKCCGCGERGCGPKRNS